MAGILNSGGHHACGNAVSNEPFEVQSLTLQRQALGYQYRVESRALPRGRSSRTR
jgi:hypothetical protein